jgi:NAD(P)-dependent dehydrogenase (short-subunit alcohol dehydrogenase family)
MPNPQRVLLFGARGKLGTAVAQVLTERGHTVIAASRSSVEHRVDITSGQDITRLYEGLEEVDAIATATGHVPYKFLSDMSGSDYEIGFQDKVLAQIEIVRRGLQHVSARGSFTLITGIFSRSPVPMGTAAAMANGAIEGFVRAAAIEIAPQRINAISPTVFTESVAAAGGLCPGFPPVPLAAVAEAYVRSIEGAQTGQIYELGQ